MRIVFCGSGPFAVPSLRAVVSGGHEVAAVITQPARPAGRGGRLRATPVARAAAEAGLHVMECPNVNAAEAVSGLRAAEPEVLCVADFGQLIRAAARQVAPHGAFNLHASLLPALRGAAPINWVIINGESRTGVTTFFIEEKVDTGEILLQQEVPIDRDITAGELHDELARLGASLLLDTVLGLARQDIHPMPQHGPATRAPKIIPELCRIDWHRSAREVHNLVRGLSPMPAAVAGFGPMRLKIVRTRLSERPCKERLPGEVMEVGKNGPVTVATGSGTIDLLQIQPPGRRIMEIGEFIQGNPVNPGDFLT